MFSYQRSILNNQGKKVGLTRSMPFRNVTAIKFENSDLSLEMRVYYIIVLFILERNSERKIRGGAIAGGVSNGAS